LEMESYRNARSSLRDKSKKRRVKGESLLSHPW
jgi:hypothetical protein